MTNPSLATIRWGIAASKKKAVEGAFELYGTAAASTLVYRRTNGDDATWLSITKPFTGAVGGIAYSKTLKRFVMTNFTSAQVARSDDKGATWTTSSSPQPFKKIIWVEELNLFFAVGGTSCYRSADGITWTAATTISGSAWDRLSWAPGVGTGVGRLVVSYNRYVCYSDNGGVTFNTQVDAGWTGISGHKWSPYYNKWFFSRSTTTPSLFDSVDLATFTSLDSIQAATDVEVLVGWLGIAPATDRIITCGTSQGRYNTDAAATVFASNSAAVAAADICGMQELNRIVICPSGSDNIRETTAPGVAFTENLLSPVDAYTCICYHYGE